jgi:ribosome-associated protein
MKGPIIPESELHWTYARSSGPGGQNVNKVNSKAVLRWNVVQTRSIPEMVRIRFLATYQSKINHLGEVGLSSDRYRDQIRNREDCLDKLKEMLSAVWRPPKIRRETKPTRSSQRSRLASKQAHSEKKASRGRVKE